MKLDNKIKGHAARRAVKAEPVFIPKSIPKAKPKKVKPEVNMDLDRDGDVDKDDASIAGKVLSHFSRKKKEE